MTDRTTVDWDDAFDNSGYVAGSALLPDQWAAEAKTMRAAHLTANLTQLDQRYGTGERERYDLFVPPGPANGTVVFVHGGYWCRFDKSYWSHYAQGCLERGWSVAVLSYPLAPQARISEITATIARAITHLSETVYGPLSLIGHSAGGHLVTRMLCKSVLPEALIDRIDRIVSVSGVHHLSPLLMTKMNTTLRLSSAEAEAESPALLEPHEQVPITFWVGNNERPEFLRQTRIMAEAWAEKTVEVRTVFDPGKNHFSVIESLRSADGALTNEILR